MSKLKPNSLKLKVGDTLKVGTRQFLIHKGDYILDNRSCYQFCSAGGRTLFSTKSGRYNQNNTNIQLPKKLIAAIDFDDMIKIEKSPEESVTKGGLTYYKFRE